MKAATFGQVTVAALTASLLAACGGSDNNDDSVSQTATFNLGISDAPIDAAEAVVVCFNAVELTGQGQPIQYEVGVDVEVPAENDLCRDSNGDVIANTIGIDLLQFTGSEQTQFLQDATIAAGNYGQLRLVMGEGSYASVDLDGEGTTTDVPVSVPSNELKLDGFTADAGGNLNYTAEFDLRQGMTNPVGQEGFILKPRGVRLVDNSSVGHLQGSVSEELLLNETSCEVAPADLTTPVAYIYLYEGVGYELSALADIGGSEEQQPYASTAVYFDGASSYDYELGFVSAGEYTAALTCNGNDDSETDDDISFLHSVDVTIEESNQPQTVDFEPVTTQ
ncbi:MAG: hypothetical protein CMF12_00905 [Idiomarina sp.]|uniref:DUF4382 domain-containing protein n=1 Tax=Idiomarina sp. TaxID=1874361 RepID=UPI000C3C60D1|nr:DUF4382 domain-containing protein [Idiomarina sp.]MBT41060.1 hypothetical protein [Idiomarina sp.]